MHEWCHGSGGKNIKWKRSGARAEQHSPFTLVQRLGNTLQTLAHHPIHQPVEQHLQRTWHIAPIARSPDNQYIACSDELEHTLGIVFRQYACLLCATHHASLTRRDMQIGNTDRHDLHPCLYGFFFHRAQHTGYVPLRAGTGIEYQHVHTTMLLPYATPCTTGRDMK